MRARPRMRVYHWVWCLGGFLFPVALETIGLVFFRGHPPTEAELAQAVVRPDLLVWWVDGLAFVHLVGGALALTWWHTRWPVCVATAVQFGCTLYCWFLSRMAVQGLRL